METPEDTLHSDSDSDSDSSVSEFSTRAVNPADGYELPPHTEFTYPPQSFFEEACEYVNELSKITPEDTEGM